MDFNIKGSTSWESDAFQDKFINDYFGDPTSNADEINCNQGKRKSINIKRKSPVANYDDQNIQKRKKFSSFSGKTKFEHLLNKSNQGETSFSTSINRSSFSNTFTPKHSVHKSCGDTESSDGINNSHKKEKQKSPLVNSGKSDHNKKLAPHSPKKKMSGHMRRNSVPEETMSTHFGKQSFDKFKQKNSVQESCDNVNVNTGVRIQKSFKRQVDSTFRKEKSQYRNSHYTEKQDISEQPPTEKNVSFLGIKSEKYKLLRHIKDGVSNINRIFKTASKKEDSLILEPSKNEDQEVYLDSHFSFEKNNQNMRSLLLTEKAKKNLEAAKFRLLNQKLYTVPGQEANQHFKCNEKDFADYHHGYQMQVKKWPINPVDLIIKDLRQIPSSSVIADLGCGDAKIAQTFPKRKVHSFDLVALNKHVTCCDISKVSLSKESTDIAVFCLSLMGVNLSDYIREAFRILKQGGILKIAEVESRIENLGSFIKSIEAYGFSLLKKDISHKMFLLMDFNKVKKSLKKAKLPSIDLNPCLYKKR